MKTTPFDEFLRGYMTALWWSSTDRAPGGGEDDMVELDQFEPSEEAVKKCTEDCRAFYDANEKDIDEAAGHYDLSNGDGADTGYDFAGHDFALTRNGHGAGFWDGDLPKELGQRLTKACDEMGPAEAYLGDDSLIYVG